MSESVRQPDVEASNADERPRGRRLRRSSRRPTDDAADRVDDPTRADADDQVDDRTRLDADDQTGEAAEAAGDERQDDNGAARLPARRPRPTWSDRASGILHYDEIPGELAEAIRGIINRNELRAGSPLPRSIAVTSAMLGEGVTLTSQALATIIAQEMSRFACWVDCSWLRPDPPAASDDRPSLIDILADNSKIEAAFQTSAELPQLVSLSPAPVPDDKRNLIVRSPEFERLLNILTDEFDHVIFDLPPVLANANALALLRRADTSLLVAQHRSTTLSHVERMVVAMDPTPNLGILLNRYDPRMPVRLRRLLGE